MGTGFQEGQHQYIQIYLFVSILVLNPRCSQQMQVSLDVAEGLLQPLLPLLQRSASSVQMPVHINVLLWAEVATRYNQGSQTFLQWEEQGGWWVENKQETRVRI